MIGRTYRIINPSARTKSAQATRTKKVARAHGELSPTRWPQSTHPRTHRRLTTPCRHCPSGIKIPVWATFSWPLGSTSRTFPSFVRKSISTSIRNRPLTSPRTPTPQSTCPRCVLVVYRQRVMPVCSLCGGLSEGLAQGAGQNISEMRTYGLDKIFLKIEFKYSCSRYQVRLSSHTRTHTHTSSL